MSDKPMDQVYYIRNASNNNTTFYLKLQPRNHNSIIALQTDGLRNKIIYGVASLLKIRLLITLVPKVL